MSFYGRYGYGGFGYPFYGGLGYGGFGYPFYGGVGYGYPFYGRGCGFYGCY